MATEKFVEYNFTEDSEKIVNQAVAICNRYRREGYDLSLRQLFYQFISQDVFPNEERSYKRLGDLVSNARLCGRLDWDMIKDRGREMTSLPHWENRADFLRSVMKQYRIDTWHNQPCHVEVMVEKQALEGVLEPVCRRLDINFTANKGYSSLSAMYEAGKRLQEQFLGTGTMADYEIDGVLYRPDSDYWNVDELDIPSEDEISYLRNSEKDKDWAKAEELLAKEAREYMKPHPEGGKALHIIYLGDHDPSGIDMTRDVKERLEMFARCPVSVHRVALNMDQVRQYNPPPNPAKLTDSRATDYIRQFGETSWELDALSPSILAALVTSMVESLRDDDIYDRTKTEMLAHREELVAIADNYDSHSEEEEEEDTEDDGE
jgi:hypothetical protein